MSRLYSVHFPALLQRGSRPLRLRLRPLRLQPVQGGLPGGEDPTGGGARLRPILREEEGRLRQGQEEEEAAVKLCRG